MPNTGYVPFNHYLVKSLKNVSFPVTKQDLIALVGEDELPFTPDKNVKLSDILQKLCPTTFPCATALYCAVNATLEKEKTAK